MTANPLTDEAARLVGMLEDWVRAGGLSSGWGERLSAAAAASENPMAGPLGWAAEHVGGSQECRLCPFCQVLAVLRGAQPETFDHLAQAVGHLADAVRVTLEGMGKASASRRPVQRIDIT